MHGIYTQVLQNKTDTAGGFKWRLARGNTSGGSESATGAVEEFDDDEVRGLTYLLSFIYYLFIYFILAGCAQPNENCGTYLEIHMLAG